jgi:hypothetical protein
MVPKPARALLTKQCRRRPGRWDGWAAHTCAKPRTSCRRCCTARTRHCAWARLEYSRHRPRPHPHPHQRLRLPSPRRRPHSLHQTLPPLSRPPGRPPAPQSLSKTIKNPCLSQRRDCSPVFLFVAPWGHVVTRIKD